MKKMVAVCGLAVLVAGCQPSVPVESGDEPSLSVVDFVTTLGAEENEQLRERLGSFIVAATDEDPPVLMAMSELSSPAFIFHIGSDCSTALSYVEGLLARAGAGESQPSVVSEIGCVEVGQRN